MRNRWAFAAAAGEGALLGALAGAARGALEVHAHRDLAHRMYWLAAERTIPPAFWWSLAGALAALLLAATLALAGRPGTKGPRVFAAIVAGLALVGAALLVGPWRAWLIADPTSTRLYASLLWGTAQIGAGLAFVAGRIADVWRDGGPGRRRRWAGAAGSAALAVLALAHLALPAIGAARVGERPSVIFVSLDTLRADRLGELGGPTDLMPNLDAFARDGLLFERAQAPAPWTLPSHASLFTGRLPFDHGARFWFSRIHPRLVMLAERLREAGYATASFNGNAYVGSSFGFAQGFDPYGERDEQLHGGVEGIVDDTIAWVRANADRPFFLFVHTYEPHVPYLSTERANAADRGRVPKVFRDELLVKLQKREISLDERERRYVRALYDGDAARTDRAFGRLLGALAETGVLDRSILVVFSDHGESLWDRPRERDPGHGHSLARELLHVPLIVRAPGRVATGRVRTPVGLIDVAPTLFELLGLPPERHHAGRSLLSTLETGAEPEPVPVYAESVEYGPDRFAAFADGYKAIVVTDPAVANSGVTMETTPLEVYDLAADPQEKNDLGAAPPRAAARAVALAFQRARATLNKRETHATADMSDPELQRTLKSLGYVQ